MKKRYAPMLSIMFMVFALIGTKESCALIIDFEDTKSFSGSGFYKDLPYLEIGDNSNFYSYDYSHYLLFDPQAISIVEATISLTHAKNSNNNGELWFLYDDSSEAIKLGQLSGSNDNWVTDMFVLPSSLYPVMPAASWTLAVKLIENTTGNDQLYLNKSVISGKYVTEDVVAPVPEPGTLLLLGSGLAGLVAYKRRKKS